MNTFEKRSKESYNSKAKDYDSTHDGRFTAKFKRLLTDTIELPKDSIVLDIACGNGRLLKQLSEKAVIKGYGVDISDKMIETAKQKYPQIEFQIAACDKLPFSNEFCDVVTVCASFHHFPDVHAFAQEAGRVLKKDGMIHIAEIYLPTILRIICNPFVRFSKAGDVRFYSPDKITEIFECHGFAKRKIAITDNVQIVSLQKV